MLNSACAPPVFAYLESSRTEELAVAVSRGFVWLVGSILTIVVEAAKSKDQAAVLLPEKFTLRQHEVLCGLEIESTFVMPREHGQKFRRSTSAGNHSSKCTLWSCVFWFVPDAFRDGKQ